MSCFIYPRDLLKSYFPPSQLFNVTVVPALVGGGWWVVGGGWCLVVGAWWVVGGAGWVVGAGVAYT